MGGEEKATKPLSLRSPLGIMLSVFLALLAVATVAATVYQIKNGGGCILLSLAGIPCPSCGLTRATLYALMGRFKTAFSYHPLFFVPYVMLGVGICSVPMKKYRKQLLAATVILAIAMAVCWIVRLALGWRGYAPI